MRWMTLAIVDKHESILLVGWHCDGQMISTLSLSCRIGKSDFFSRSLNCTMRWMKVAIVGMINTSLEDLLDDIVMFKWYRHCLCVVELEKGDFFSRSLNCTMKMNESGNCWQDKHQFKLLFGWYYDVQMISSLSLSCRIGKRWFLFKKFELYNEMNEIGNCWQD